MRTDGGANSTDTASAVAVRPDGGLVYVTGTGRVAGTNNDLITVALVASTGAEAWRARYDNGGDDGGQAVSVAPDGSRVYVTGYSFRSNNYDFVTIAYDAGTGAQLWVARYQQANNDLARTLAVSPDGTRVFVAGESVGSGNDFATVAYDALTGTQLWASRYAQPAADLAKALAVAPDGSTVFVTGPSNATTTDFATVAYDAATGTQRWVARYDAGGSDSATALGVSPDGSTVVVTGSSVTPGRTTTDFATVAYDAATGTQRWVARYDGPAAAADNAAALAVSPDGARVVVAGDSSNGSNADFATVAYGLSNGLQQWVARYDSGSADTPVALQFRPDASAVYVAGNSGGLAVVAHDAASGAQLWVVRTASATAAKLAVAANGQTAYAVGSLSGDYLTVAYAIRAQVALLPSAVDFGSKRVGHTAPAQSITLRNAGSAHLHLGTVSVTGPDAAAFALVSDGCSQQSLAPEATCSLGVTFTPPATGAQQATVSIPSDAPGSPHGVALSGIGIQPQVSLSTTALDFGSQRVGRPSSAQVITLTNTGSDTLAVGTVSVTGPDAAAFALVSDGCSQQSLAPEATCSLGVTFTPPATGAQQATVSIPSDAPGSPHGVALSGIGIQPQVSLSTTALDFGGIEVGLESEQTALTLTNSGTDLLAMGRVTLGGPDASAFSVAEDNCSLASLEPGSACTISLTFRPLGRGPATATLSIPSDAPSSPDAVGLAGRGLAPTLTVDTHAMSFPVTATGQTAEGRLLVANQGDAPLRLGTPAVGGPHAAEFSVDSSACAQPVAPGSSCQLGITFQPGAGGLRSAVMTLTSNDPSGDVGVGMRGRGDANPPEVGLMSGQSVLLRLRGDRLRGQVSDDGGVDSVRVTYAPLLPTGAQTVEAVVAPCSEDAALVTCTWSAALPSLPGVWEVRAEAVDAAGRSAQSGSLLVVVV